jgi:hypothetical protein
MTYTPTTFLAGLEAEGKQCLIQKDTQAFMHQRPSYQETIVGLSPISARSALYALLMLTRHNNGVLFRNKASRSLRHICWRWNLSITVKKNGHLLQSMASRLRIEKINRDAQKNEHDDEDEIVLPANAFKSNGVDEGVEEYGDHGSRQSDDQATGTKAVRPDLTRISGLERRPGSQLALEQKQRHSSWNSHCDVVASKEDEEKRNDCDTRRIRATLCKRTR